MAAIARKGASNVQPDCAHRALATTSSTLSLRRLPMLSARADMAG